MTIRRTIFLGVLVVLTIGLVAPHLSADRFGERIRLSLEQSLHRKVTIESAGFSLFRGPGFTLRNVVISDDPAAGLEPFIYVGAIEARLSLASLWKGRLEFSALRLEEPSVNLVKTAAGPWSFQPLLRQSSAARMPAISVRGGRLNFKLGTVKSAFYFANTDLDVMPSTTPGGTFTIQFSGDPARSDRTGRAFGSLRGQGRWRPSAIPGGELDIQVSLEQSSMGEVVRLIHGEDVGVHGQIAGQARFRGTLSNLDITGALQLSEIHRWDLLPPYAEGGPLNFRGQMDLVTQSLEIETVPSRNTALGVRFRASDYLTHPRWAVALTLNGVPIPPLVEMARHMGAGLVEAARMDGAASGAIVYSPEDGFHGGVSLNGSSISIPGSVPVRLLDALLILDGRRVRLSPALVSVGEQERATLEFDYSFGEQQFDLKLTTQEMSIAALQAQSVWLPDAPEPQFVSRFRGGSWNGSLRYRKEKESPGQWSGAVRLHQTQLSLPGLAQPLTIHSAEVTAKGDRIRADRFQATAGEVTIQGEYTYVPEARRPHRIVCRIPKLDSSELERLSEPTISRPRSLISRALRLTGGTTPEWLASRHAAGSVEIGSLLIAGQQFESVRLEFFWDGPRLDVARLRARVQGGSVDGHFTADFSGPQPVLQAGGRFESVAWRGGRLEGDATLRTSGAGDDLYWNLRAEGSFQALSVNLGPELPVRAMSGSWGLRWDRKAPRLELNDLRFVDGQDVLTGQGATTEDRRLQIDLSHGERHLRLSGSLQPILLEASESR